MQDKHLKPLLDMYRKAGRKVFLATNSLWDYTNVVMNFVVDGRVGSDRSTEWLQVHFHLNLCKATLPFRFNSDGSMFPRVPMCNSAGSSVHTSCKMLLRQHEYKEDRVCYAVF